MYIVCVFVYLVYFQQTVKANQWTMFERKSFIDGMQCQDTDVEFFEDNLRDIGMCMFECTTHSNCESIFYVPPTGSCTGCKVVYETTQYSGQTTPGSVYYWKAGCPMGWFKIKKSCYFTTPYMPFNSGVSMCQSRGAHPVVIETEEENELLKYHLRIISSDSTAMFFSGYKKNGTYNYEWRATSNNETLSVSSWALGEPNGGLYEPCLAFYSACDFQWIDISCVINGKTICEKESQN